MQCPELESYLPMIAQKAFQTWCKLPSQYKVWLDVDDLIQEGVLFTRFHVFPRYKPSGGKFTTYLYAALDHFYYSIVHDKFYQKRTAEIVPIADVEHKLIENDETEKALHAVSSLHHILAEASPHLLKCLHQWIFTRDAIVSTGPRFRVARKELLKIATKYRFERDDFAYLLRRETWRRSFEPIRKKYCDPVS
jgi:hypothetical protein